MKKYIEKIKKISHVSQVETQDKNLIVTSNLKDSKLQISWNILQEVYDKDFTKQVNQIIVL